MPRDLAQWAMLVLFVAWCATSNIALFRNRKVVMSAGALLFLAIVMQILLIFGGFYTQLWNRL